MSTITPKTHSTIINQIRQKGYWKGTRNGVQLCFELCRTARAMLQICWAARIKGKWHYGVTATVEGAVLQIDKLMLNKSGRRPQRQKPQDPSPHRKLRP